MEDHQVEREGFTMVPNSLILGKFSGDSLLCFLAMGVVGPKKRAKVSTYARLMRKKDKRIASRALGELQVSGFIRLKTPATSKAPAIYEQWPFGVRQTLPLEGLGVRLEGPQETHPSHTNKESQTKAEGSLLHRAAIGLFKRAWGDRYQENYTPTPIDHRKLKELLKEEVLPAEFSARLKGYLASNDSFVAGQRHSFSLFISQFNKWPLIDEGPNVPKLVI